MTKGKIKAVQKAVLGMLLWVAASTAEAKPILRHVEGLHGIEANAGITAIGKSLAIEWSYYFSPCWQIKAGIGAAIDKLLDPAYTNFFTQPVVGYTLFHNNRNLFLNILVGLCKEYFPSLLFADQQRNRQRWPIGQQAEKG